MLTKEEKERVFYDSGINCEGRFDADYHLKLLFGSVKPNRKINDETLFSTKLHCAVITKDCSPQVIKDILRDDPSLLNQRNLFKIVPLHRAVYYGKNLNVVIELLRQGAAVNAAELSDMTPLHVAALNSNENQYLLFKTLIDYGANVNCQDYLDQTPLHVLVKNSFVQEKALHLLLSKGANPNVCDKALNCVLKLALCNPFVSLHVVKMILKFGANPDDLLMYCLDNLSQAKVLIQYCAVKKINTFCSEEVLLPDRIVDLTSCSDIDSYLELVCFRDNCVNELMAMRKVNITENYTLFKFISEHCSNVSVCDESKQQQLLIDALFCLKSDKYSYCQDLIEASFGFSNILNILAELEVYAKKGNSNNPCDRIYLNYYAVNSLVSFLPKIDVINLTLAYMHDFKSADCNKYTSKSVKRIHEGLCDSMIVMKRLKL